jgi:PAS domain S-box-containing protein
MRRIYDHLHRNGPGYLVAVLATCMIALLRSLLSYALGESAPLLLFVGAVVAAAYVGGLPAGLLATVLSSLTGAYLFIHPHSGIVPERYSDQLQLLLFAGVGATISWLYELLLRARRRLNNQSDAQRQARDEAEQWRERYEAAIQASGSILYDSHVPSGQVVFGGDCLDILGYSPEELNGDITKWMARIESEDIPHFEAAMDRIRASGVAEQVEYRMRRKDGAVVWMRDEGQSLTRRGNTLRIIGFVKDVTEQRQTQDELRHAAWQLTEADRRKDEFLATLAHELRNPLAAIRTGLEVLLLAKHDRVIQDQTQCTLQRQTQQLITLVDDLLDVSRIAQGKLSLRKVRVRLADIVQSAVEASRPLIEEAGHQLTVALPDAPIDLLADPNRLAQVVSNLLNNAAKYTPRGGFIWLAVERQGDQALISVRDTGAGIPAAMQERIFDMFAQIDRPLEYGHTGLGIGLKLVKSLVELHEGTVEVRSAGSNHGSEFRVLLPAESSVHELVAQAAPRAEYIQDHPRTRVLVVDDNRAAADMLSLAIRLLDYETCTANDGREALRVAEQFRPQAILMDLGLPELSGYEAAQAIRRQPWGRDVTLIALTGWGHEEVKQRAAAAGFDFHLVKPAEPAEIQQLLSGVHAPSL